MGVCVCETETQKGNEAEFSQLVNESSEGYRGIHYIILSTSIYFVSFFFFFPKQRLVGKKLRRFYIKF